MRYPHLLLSTTYTSMSRKQAAGRRNGEIHSNPYKLIFQRVKKVQFPAYLSKTIFLFIDSAHSIIYYCNRLGIATWKLWSCIMKNQNKIQHTKLMECLVSFIRKHQVVLIFSLLLYVICSNFAFSS